MKRALIGRAFTKKRNGHPVFPHLSGRQSGTAGWWQARTNNPAATEFVNRVEQVHVPALALPEPRDLAEHLGRHFVERNPLGNGKVMRPMSADHRIFLLQMSAYANSHRFLSR